MNTLKVEKILEGQRRLDQKRTEIKQFLSMIAGMLTETPGGLVEIREARNQTDSAIGEWCKRLVEGMYPETPLRGLGIPIGVLGMKRILIYFYTTAGGREKGEFAILVTADEERGQIKLDIAQLDPSFITWLHNHLSVVLDRVHEKYPEIWSRLEPYNTAAEM